MAENNPEKDPASADPEPDAPPESGPETPRRRSLTPEQRRFLNQPRSTPAEHRSDAPPAEDLPSRTRHAPARPSLMEEEKVSRGFQLRQAIFVLVGIAGIGLAFYFGTKINYLKYLLTSRHQPSLTELGAAQFQGVGADDLVEQALVAERDGRWQDAVERFMAAKRKNLQYRGILFRVGKILYDHRDFAHADQAFERALAFGENPDAANFFRGLIAVRTKNLTAAERFFAAAVTAAPFVSDYHYYLGETLRLDLKPKPAIPCYAQAALLARDEQSAAVCRFKMRMARIDAAESEAVNSELTKAQASGPLSVDWLMTAAALKIREGQIDDARPFIEQARAGNSPGLFASCVNDLYFRDVAQKYPELADALHLDL
ncbi:MAG: hypothetical protein ABI217_10795, partial [Chthoniobacterales bacterium]